ncbi:MAG: type II toxin-antitoxin system antitoxin SocA domain-containing protein [bacterium]
MTEEKSKVTKIANFFIKLGREQNREVTNKKLQKLLYYAQAWSVTLRNKTLFVDDIEAWVHGPALPKIYNLFSQYGREDLGKVVLASSLDIEGLSLEEIDLLKVVWNVYGKYTGNDLEVLSHSELPWQQARQGLEPYESSKKVITIKSMKDYYGKKTQ